MNDKSKNKITKRVAFTDFDEQTTLESLQTEMTKPEALRFSVEEIAATETGTPVITEGRSVPSMQTESTKPDSLQIPTPSSVPEEDRTTARSTRSKNSEKPH